MPKALSTWRANLDRRAAAEWAEAMAKLAPKISWRLAVGRGGMKHRHFRLTKVHERWGAAMRCRVIK